MPDEKCTICYRPDSEHIKLRPTYVAVDCLTNLRRQLAQREEELAAQETEIERLSTASYPIDREFLGRLVRQAWVAWAQDQPDAKAHWLVTWHGLDERMREVDRRIGEQVASVSIAIMEREIEQLAALKAIVEKPWLVLIQAERKRQDEKWGEQNHNDEKWLAILVEEVGELAQAILKGGKTTLGELVQTTAVGVVWLEAIERREAAEARAEKGEGDG